MLMHGGKDNACLFKCYLRLLRLFRLCFSGYTFTSLHSYVFLFKASTFLVTARLFFHQTTRSRVVRVLPLWHLRDCIPS